VRITHLPKAVTQSAKAVKQPFRVYLGTRDCQGLREDQPSINKEGSEGAEKGFSVNFGGFGNNVVAFVLRRES